VIIKLVLCQSGDVFPQRSPPPSVHSRLNRSLYIIRVFLFSAAKCFHFCSPAGLGSPAAARAHSSLPSLCSTCSYLAKPGGLLKAWRRAICCPTLHHFTPNPSCLHASFLFETHFDTERWRKSWNVLADKSQNLHLAAGGSCECSGEIKAESVYLTQVGS